MMMTMCRLAAMKARVDTAPDAMKAGLMVELGVALKRRERERAPSKRGRRMRRRVTLGRLGTC